MARENGNRAAQSISLGNLGNAFLNLGEPSQAIHYYEEQLQITREVRDLYGEGSALANLGVACKALGDTGGAIALYSRALKISCKIGDRSGRVRRWASGQRLFRRAS